MKIKHVITLVLWFVLSHLVFSGCDWLGDKKSATSTDYPISINHGIGSGDFITAAKAAMPAVVHIGTQLKGSTAQGGSGSGVIVNKEGYIATNNHVIENAGQINVTLPDKRRFIATLIGRDPDTDLALLKIDAGSNLPIIQMGNSDLVQIGEGVLAIGYPLSLNTTVTAGIVSAKARNIGIIKQQNKSNPPGTGLDTLNTAIESFIQTDAAINQGNSGGALVNANGYLIGINSGIASKTGSFSGYSFAIPVNLAKKILDDLKRYGKVNRGILGVSFPSPSAEDKHMIQQGLDPAVIKGVYITGVQNESAAATAGLKKGDVIQSIDGIPLSSSTELSERIGRHKPGDLIMLRYLRDNTSDTASVTLKAEPPGENLLNPDVPLVEIYSRLGATFTPITAEIKQRYNLDAGVVVTNIRKDGFFEQVGVLKGTIIALINSRPVNSSTDIDAALLSSQNGMIRIFAIAPDGSEVIFEFFIGT